MKRWAGNEAVVHKDPETGERIERPYVLASDIERAKDIASMSNMTNLKQGPCGHYICEECACVVERDRLAAELEKMDHNDRAAIEGFHRTIDRYKADLASSDKEMGRLAAENEKLQRELAEAYKKTKDALGVK